MKSISELKTEFSLSEIVKVKRLISEVDYYLQP